MLRKIKLHGTLAAFIGRRTLEADVSSAAEAIRFLVANWPGLEAHMANQYYQISLNDYDLGAEELHYPAGQQEIRVTPVISGAGGLGRAILGAALLVAAFAIPGFAAWAGPTAFKVITTVGASLLLGGVAQLISPVPKIPQGANSDQDPRKTYNFSGIQQTSRQGVPLPIVYGKTLTGSVVVSAGVDTVQVKA